jgi:hypothetical protein
MNKTPLVLAAVALLAGCSAAKNLLDTGNCSYTLSGAVTASGTCSATCPTNNNNSEVAIINGGTETGTFLEGAAAGFPGVCATGTYTSTGTSTTNGAIVVENNAVTAQWVANYRNGEAPLGSYSFTVTSVSASAIPQTSTIHGTGTGTLVPSPAANNTATGTVNVSIKF